ncbi:MAG: DUF1996 domain-containing protein [Rhizobacter sp.]
MAGADDTAANVHAAHAGHGPMIDRARLAEPAAGAPNERIRAAAAAAEPSDIGAFRTICAYSHMAFDDPIVYPGEPGKSHLHVFFGNTGTNAYSTATSLAKSGNSTCLGGIANRSAYWVPATIDTRTGTPLVPGNANLYYKNGYNGIGPSQVRPLPAGLRMIAGDATNSTDVWKNGKEKWHGSPYQFKCIGNIPDYMASQEIPNCPVGTSLWEVVTFPQCWDGRRLDSPDHKSHMSYAVNRRCPDTHPVPVPEITFNIIYPVREKDATLHWRLASDMYDPSLPGGRSMHADWFDGWSQPVKEAWVKGCNQAQRDCHSFLLGDGRELY